MQEVVNEYCQKPAHLAKTQKEDYTMAKQKLRQIVGMGELNLRYFIIFGEKTAFNQAICSAIKAKEESRNREENEKLVVLEVLQDRTDDADANYFQDSGKISDFITNIEKFSDLKNTEFIFIHSIETETPQKWIAKISKGKEGLNLKSFTTYLKS